MIDNYLTNGNHDPERAKDEYIRALTNYAEMLEGIIKSNKHTPEKQRKYIQSFYSLNVAPKLSALRAANAKEYEQLAQWKEPLTEAERAAINKLLKGNEILVPANP